MLLNKNASTKAKNTQQSVDNSAKTLLANVRFMSVDNPVRTVVITSAIPNEGKTFVAANLARAMATSGVRTLLVECDMRRRSMSHALHVHAQHGLYSVMSAEISLKDAVVPTGTRRLHFLDAEPHIPNPSDLLNSQRFAALIAEMKNEFGYIVFDTPPVGTFVDAAVLGAKVDALFMVVREQYTRKDEVVRAADQLKTANVPLSGIIMNFCERQSNEYYYDYYYREGRPKKRTEDKLEAKAAKQKATAPRNWNNAPDLSELDAIGGESEPISVEFDTGVLQMEEQPRTLNNAVPSIGQTGVIDRDDIRRVAGQ